MALFTLNSEITIGTFSFSGVNEVRIKRSLFHPTVTAYITVPSKAFLKKKSSSSVEEVTTSDKFVYRDPVTIKLGYNGELKTEFEGFVKSCNTNMPLTIECEGYIQNLRLNKLPTTKYGKEVDLKFLLKLVTANTGITAVAPQNITFGGIQLNKCKTPADILSKIREAGEGALTTFFIDDKVLWCGLVYTPMNGNNDPFHLGMVNFRPRFNCIHSNSLVRRESDTEPVKIIGISKRPDGELIKVEAGAKNGTEKKLLFKNIPDKSLMQKIVQERYLTENYEGYEGSIQAFLQPYCRPGFLANIVNKQYPKLDGKYMITSTEVVFGVNGARRRVEIGPRLGFKIG
jgi:hypothetical protein